MSKRNIGILTLFSKNYGAILQAYALQTYLKSKGHSVEHIKYVPDDRDDNRTSFMKIRTFILEHTIQPFVFDRARDRKTNTFRKVHMGYSRNSYCSREELINESFHYDAFIVGSDQVWNPWKAGDSSLWFLGFAKEATRIAYAASFGLSELPEQYRIPYSQYIKSLDYVSIREETGARIIKEICNQDVEVVVDPVFLLDVEHWSSIAVKPVQENYILCYYMPGYPAVEKEMQALARRYALETGSSIINIGKRDFNRLLKQKSDLYGVGPAEFIGLIEHAKMIITNSFHGTAFSVLFEKEFLSVVDSGSQSSTLSSRIVDFLYRIAKNGNLIDIARENRETLNGMQSNLESEINKSKYFLMNALEDSTDEFMR